MQVTEEARQCSCSAEDGASQKDAEGHAQQTADAGNDCVREGQAQGELAQQAKATADSGSRTAQNAASEAAQPLPAERLAAQTPKGATGEALPSFSHASAVRASDSLLLFLDFPELLAVISCIPVLVALPCTTIW